MRRGRARVGTVAFLSDYGLTDPFVGICHGVIARITPSARVIDLSHGVPPQDVRAGAVQLADSVAYLPPAVMLAVVDPGVGTSRRGVVLVCGAGGALLVGPDNGLLWPAAEALGGVRSVFVLDNPAYQLTPLSRTFHGRDVFAPAAAYLAGGLPAERLGSRVDADGLVRLVLPGPVPREDGLDATVLLVDRFGNLSLDARPADLGAALGATVELRGGAGRWTATVAATFAEAAPAELALIEDASGRLAVAVNQGRAVDRLDAVPGTVLSVRGLPPGHPPARG
jgi:hypothetical protein